MEPSDWLPSVVALFVGIGSVFLTNQYAKGREERDSQKSRLDALTNYERELTDWSLYYFSAMGVGAGNHPRPKEEDLRNTRAAAYPYLQEFRGHSLWGSIISPYYEEMPGDNPNEPMEFYDRAAEAIKAHLEQFPLKPEGSPYLKGE